MYLSVYQGSAVFLLQPRLGFLFHCPAVCCPLLQHRMQLQSIFPKSSGERLEQPTLLPLLSPYGTLQAFWVSSNLHEDMIFVRKGVAILCLPSSLCFVGI